MRLDQWPQRAPHKDALTPKVRGVIEPAIAALGGDPDPECWIVWGDDPAIRYTVLALSEAGLVLVAVRVNVPQEGPRSSGKLIRWNRVQTGELAMDIGGGHRLLSFQIEGLVLRGSDAEAEEIAAFALDVFAGMDGRPLGTRSAAGARVKAPGKTAPAARPAVLRLPGPKGRSR
jgi:hypothetical protein